MLLPTSAQQSPRMGPWRTGRSKAHPRNLYKTDRQVLHALLRDTLPVCPFTGSTRLLRGAKAILCFKPCLMHAGGLMPSDGQYGPNELFKKLLLYIWAPLTERVTGNNTQNKLEECEL